MTLVIPNVFQDGDIEEASGVEVNENFAAVKAAVDALQTLLTGFVEGALPSGFKIRAGTGTITWAGGIGTSVVAHGIGKLPTAMFAESYLEENSVVVSSVFYGQYKIGVKNFDINNIAFQWSAAPGTPIGDGPATKMHWVAIG